MSYSHFTKEDRIKLDTLRTQGYFQKEIALLIGKSTSAVSRELKRNSKADGSYRYGAAYAKAKQRQAHRNAQRHKLIYNLSLQKKITKELKKNWSPEQIAGRAKRDNQGVALISHQSIYQWIYKHKPELKKYLRCKKGKYRRKHGTKLREKRRNEAKKVRIDNRSKAIDNREQVGHFEGDTIIGRDKKHAITTQVDRKSGYLLADKVNSRCAEPVRKALMKSLKKLPKKKRKSETFDNGVEFSEWEFLKDRLHMDIYFAYPYHSWERGTNENTNGLLREYFPKGTDFTHITKHHVKRAQAKLNHRPRKKLNYLTPHEVFIKNCTLD